MRCSKVLLGKETKKETKIMEPLLRKSRTIMSQISFGTSTRARPMVMVSSR